jgi:transglutaminase-like putative cysteine protease
MLLHVLHETRYDYVPPVKTAQHMAHLKPADTARQRLISHELEIRPAPGQQHEAIDVYGNTRAFFSLATQHDRLVVRARSRVETSAAGQPHSSPAWEDVRERLRYHRGAAYDPAAEFVFASPYVPRHAEFIAYARASFTADRPVLDGSRELMERIHSEFEYQAEATDASTPALEAMRLRKGVCQDFAHVMLACLRSMGLPARYVSGYLLTEPPPGMTRLAGSDASHAWVSVYVPGEAGAPGEWADLDPTNNRAPGEDYVTLAIGRDYSDVSPVRGVLYGGARHQLRVAVTVGPLGPGSTADVGAPTID